MEQSVDMSYAETEAVLITKALTGDRNAYGEIVRHHHTSVINVVYRMCGDVELAEDAAQEAFIQAWLHLSTFRTGTSLRNWLYRIAVNAALDVLRRAPKQIPVDVENLSIPERRPGLEAELAQKELRAEVQQAILALPEASRAVLVMREYGDLSYHEIASSLDIPLGTVMSRLNYARQRLKELLEPRFFDMELEYV